MDEGTRSVIIAGIIGSTIMLSMLAQAVVKVYTSRRSRGLPDASMARIEERLLRIEQAVDAVAVEVERISEAQRFATKLLAERTHERV